MQVPVLGTRVTFDIPQLDVLDGGEGYKALSQQHIVNACRDALSSLPEYASLMDTEMEHGASLGLAWRRQLQLDWVWLENDINGAPRDWSTLFGLAFKQVRTLSLSIVSSTYQPRSRATPQCSSNSVLPVTR